MAPKQTLPDLRRGGGHFAVFRLENFPATTDLAAANEESAASRNKHPVWPSG
jgi:hypothetical protein